MRPPSALASLIAVLVLHVGSCPALAQEGPSAAEQLALGRTRYLEADFAGARGVFREVARVAAATREELIEALRYLATIEGVLGSPAECARLARVVVALDEQVTAAEGAPPHVSLEFEQARRERSASLLEWSFDERDPDRPQLRVRSTHDLGELAELAEIEVVCGDASARGEPPRVSLALAGPHAERCTARLLLRAGRVLVSRDIALPSRAAPRADEGGADDTPWVVLGCVLGGLGVAAAVGIGVAATAGPVEGVPTWVVIEM